MLIAGLPFHPLIVHAAVVFTPLAVLAALVFAVLPRWRYLSRWPTAVLTVGAFVSVWASRLSGGSFAKTLGVGPAIATHRERGEQLSLIMIAFLVVVAVAVWGLGGPSALVSGAGARETPVVGLAKVLPVLLVVAALLVLVWVVLTGDAGARAAWER